ncbi:hypothetical protein [Acinetobacter johnsonii]|jgi:hypothetical protein|uniref:hypothetical protein n=1 Tax=Acinetobacter johnsonii TaxID=40214 RepID=UPI000994A14A|nr:hypothetical protein [Acinetobacter sp. MF4642]OOW09964.1 hypothetical protein MF4642_08820 [Acinetobacter sp. MF4642]
MQTTYTATYIDKIKQLQCLCPLQNPIAFCLNRFRMAQIHFLNLGNLIVCPEYNCVLIFQNKSLIRIDPLARSAQT